MLPVKTDIIAVLICVYREDKADYLQRCLNSLHAQSFAQFSTYLYVDGYIPVALEAVVSTFENDGGFVIRGEENRGLAFGLNRLIDYVWARGGARYFARIDADDWCAPERFSLMYQYMELHPEVGVLGSGCFEVDHRGHVIALKILPGEDSAIKDFMCRRCPFIHPSVVFRGSVLENCRYDDDKPLAEDVYLWLRLASAGVVFANLDLPLIYYTVSGGVIARRRGLKKSLLELRYRLRATRAMRPWSFASYCYAIADFMIRLSPPFVVKFSYNYLRRSMPAVR